MAFGFFKRNKPTHKQLEKKHEADPKQELMMFLSRLAVSERGRFNKAFATNGGDIRSLTDLSLAFTRFEDEMKQARNATNSDPAKALDHAEEAYRQARHIGTVAEHLRKKELHAHDKYLARDSFAVRRYADHAKEQAGFLVRNLKPLVR